MLPRSCVLVAVGVGPGVARWARRRPAGAPATVPAVPSSAAVRRHSTGRHRRRHRPEPKPGDPLTGGQGHASRGDRGQGGEHRGRASAGRAEPGRHRLRRGGRGRPDPADRDLPHTFPTRLGPVRSARSTDVQLLPLFGKPGLVYSGANSRVQGKIDKASIVPIQRSTRDNRRVAPHNVFVDLDQIADRAKVGKARSIGWTFVADSSGRCPGGQDHLRRRQRHDSPSATARRAILVRWHGQDLCRRRQPETDQDRQRGDHEGAQPRRRQPRRARHAVGAVRHGRPRQGDDLSRPDQDHGTWRRTKASGPLRFTDRSGRSIALKPGKTWVLLKG